jgi:hypothetical protein
VRFESILCIYTVATKHVQLHLSMWQNKTRAVPDNRILKMLLMLFENL